MSAGLQTPEDTAELAALFVQCGEALYGEGWKNSMADLLDIAPRSVRKMATAESRIPPGIWKDIARGMDERLVLLQELRNDIEGIE